jgi:hypothetical protein
MQTDSIRGRAGRDRTGPPDLILLPFNPACGDCGRTGRKLYTVAYPRRKICDDCFEGALADLRNIAAK